MSAEVAVQIGIASVLAILMVWGLRIGRGRTRVPLPSGSIAFLFDGDRLIDATRPARDMLSADTRQIADRDRLIALLEPRFPALRAALSDIDELGEVQIAAADGERGVVHARTWDGMLRVTLTGEERETATAISDLLAQRRIREEVTALRAMAEDSPHPMWREDRDGVIQWANRAYLDLIDKCQGGGDKRWPPRVAFADLPRLREGSAPVTTRQPVLLTGEDSPRWFAISTQWSDGQNLHVGAEVTEEVRAKELQRDLMQTVTKTFAGLSVGLAVFDRNRQLVLFNPALCDLIGLKPAQLTARPELETFLNMLREQRTVPEKKDFSAWRRQFASLEQGRGDTVESWDLPDGRRFRVTGRPFPNGAVALLVEDTSTDAELMRQLHDTLSLTREALDDVSEAVAVFSADRTLLLENTGSVALWGECEGKTLAQTLKSWAAQCHPSPGWDAFTSQLLVGQNGGDVTLPAARKDGQNLTLQARPTPTGGIVLTCTQTAQQSSGPSLITGHGAEVLARAQRAALSLR